MAFEVVENVEDRTAEFVIRRKIYRTDDPQYPSGYRYALHYGFSTVRASFSGTTTRTAHPDATNVTLPTASSRSSSLE